jgi:hypothetical protein
MIITPQIQEFPDYSDNAIAPTHNIPTPKSFLGLAKDWCAQREIKWAHI